ncbi:MAG: hypothetical protein IJT25_00335 [Clostridia bacterium]|nr:hypothetical protein [Clostridia bacterium]
MKKVLFGFVMVLLCLCIPTFLVGCDANYKALAGDYYLVQLTYQNGTTKTVDELKNNGTITSNENEFLKLSSEKAFDASGLIKTALGESMGTYSVEAEVIKIEAEAGYVIGTISGKTITINISGTTYLFVKA